MGHQCVISLNAFMVKRFQTLLTFKWWAITTAQHNKKNIFHSISLISLFSSNNILSITLHTNSQINIQSQLI